MILRGLSWLIALGALTAACWTSEWGPLDPLRRTVATGGMPASAVMVYSWADRDPRVGRFDLVETAPLAPPEPDSVRFFAAPGQMRPARWLAAYGGTPSRAQSLAEVLLALRRSEAQDLDAPLVLQTDLNFRPPLLTVPNQGQEFSTLLWPLGTAGAVERLQSRDGGVYAIDVRVSGAILTAADRFAPRDDAFWHAGRRSIPWLASTEVRPASPDDLCTEFHATHAHNPDGDQDLDHWLAWTLGRYLGDDLQPDYAIGGFYCVLRGEQHAQIRQILSDPSLIRLARDLIAAPDERRIAARRDALLGDDPLLADLAVDTLGYRDRVPASVLPDGLLAAWPHSTRTSPEQAIDARPLYTLLKQLSAAERARRLRRLFACAAEADPLAKVIAEAVLDEAPQVKAVAREALLQRLPRGVLEAYRVDYALLGDPMFLGALAERLRVELNQGDAERACDLIGPALDASPRGLHGGLRPAPSRLIELAANLLFDPVQGKRFREQASFYALTLAAEERLRDSDPEVRRAAWQVLREVDQAWARVVNTPDPGREYTADPYLEDLIAAPRAKPTLGSR